MNAVIKPTLVGGLVFAVACNVVVSGVLILSLARYDSAKRLAEENEARMSTQNAELAKLDAEVDSLTKQKEALEPMISDWQERLKQLHEAEAAAESLRTKQKQAETDLA